MLEARLRAFVSAASSSYSKSPKAAERSWAFASAARHRSSASSTACRSSSSRAACASLAPTSSLSSSEMRSSASRRRASDHAKIKAKEGEIPKHVEDRAQVAPKDRVRMGIYGGAPPSSGSTVAGTLTRVILRCLVRPVKILPEPCIFRLDLFTPLVHGFEEHGFGGLEVLFGIGLPRLCLLCLRSRLGGRRCLHRVFASREARKHLGVTLLVTVGCSCPGTKGYIPGGSDVRRKDLMMTVGKPEEVLQQLSGSVTVATRETEMEKSPPRDK